MPIARIERLLQTIEVLPLDGDVDRTYAGVRAALELVGRPIGANDLLIASKSLTYCELRARFGISF